MPLGSSLHNALYCMVPWWSRNHTNRGRLAPHACPADGVAKQGADSMSDTLTACQLAVLTSLLMVLPTWWTQRSHPVST